VRQGKVCIRANNLVPRVFSLAWGLGGAPPPSQGKDPGNEVDEPSGP